MTPAQRTRQMQAIHIEYARLFKAGTLEQLHAEVGESCHLWATNVLGRLVPTLKSCSDFELNSLRDAINGKSNKLLQRIAAEFERTGIKNPAAWIATLAQSETFRAWKGKTVEQLPVSQQYRLLKMLERRGQKSAPRPSRGGAIVQDEQRALWGM